MKARYSSPWIHSLNYKKLYHKVMHEFLIMRSDDKCFTKALRTTLIVLFTLQLLSTVERQVFDFLGYMWAPIIGNFFQIIVVILGIFGACNFYKSFIVVYTTWSLIWLGWNIFVICLYLEVGILNRNRELYILTIGTEGKSWWLEHGIGCEVNTTVEQIDEEQDDLSLGARHIPPESSVFGCILQYYYVEVIHAAVQCLLALAGFVAACVSIYASLDDDDTTSWKCCEDGLDKHVSCANDELEFVKMRYRTPTHVAAYRDDREAMAFDNLNLTTEFPDDTPSQWPRSRPDRGEREQPPSYDTTMRNMDAMTAATNYYSDRQSVRSKASTRSKRSAHRQERERERAAGGGGSSNYSEPRNLPWVQITPSSNSDAHLMRHHP